MTLPWSAIAVLVGCLVVVGGVVWLTYRLAYQKGQSEIKRDIAMSEAERRAHDAEIASKPMVRDPLTGPGGLFGE